MALDATVGGITANSYITLIQANAYFADRAFATSWDTFTEKEDMLVTASQMLDWYLKWKGTKATSEQSMQWPRVEALRPDGTEILDTVIPPELLTAVCELALSSLDGDRTIDSPLAGLEQVKVSSLMVKANKGDAESTKKETIPEKIRKILSDITTRSGGTVRLIRA